MIIYGTKMLKAFVVAKDLLSRSLVAASVVTLAACGGGGGGDESGATESKSTSVPAAPPPTSGGTNIQPVEPIENLDPVLTWVSSPDAVSMQASLVSIETFQATSDQASPVSYEFNTVDSTCLSLTWFDEISIDTLSGELRAKPTANIEGTCTLFVNAVSGATKLSQQVTVNVGSTITIQNPVLSFDVNEDQAFSGIAIQAVSSAPAPVLDYTLVASESDCDEFNMSPGVTVDPSNGSINGTALISGSCQLTVQVSDGFNSIKESFTLNIIEVDDPLIYVSGPYAITIEKGQAISTSISYSDEDNSIAYVFDSAASDCDEQSWASPLTVDVISGMITGTPSFIGSCNLVIDVQAGSNNIPHNITVSTQDTVAPLAPTNFTLTSPSSSPGSDTTPEFSVEFSEAEGEYTLHRDATCSDPFLSGTVSTTLQAIVVSNPLPDGSYQFSISHTDDSSNVSACGADVVSVVIDSTAPDAPSVTLTSSTTSSLRGSELTISASPSADVSHYLVKLEDDLGTVIFDWDQTSFLSYQSATDMSLVECSRSYFYTVKAVDFAGLESTEVQSTAFTLDQTAPSAVGSIINLSNAEVQRSEEHQFSPSSDNCGGTIQYEIAVSTSSSEGDILAGWEYSSSEALSYRRGSSSSLVVGTDYYSLIRAKDSAGNISNFTASPSWQLPGPPSAVDAVSIVSKSKDSMQLGWNEPANGGRPITDYLVEYKESSSSTWLAYADGFSNDIVLTIAGLNPDTQYDFRVTSWNGNYAPSPSPVVTDKTFPDSPFFESGSYKLMNLGGATNTSVVAFEDATEVKLDGVVIANLNAGETHKFVSIADQILEADKPIYAAGRVTGINGSNTDGNVLWSNKDLAGNQFIVTLTRLAAHRFAIFSFDADNIVTIKAPNPANDVNVTMQQDESQEFIMTDNGGFTIESTGLIIVYTFSTGNSGLVADPKPVMPASTDLIGIPSRSVKFTTLSSTADVDYLHGDDNTGMMTVTDGGTKSITGRAKFDGTNSQYRAQPLRLRSSEPIVGNSNADSDGYCSSPFVPTVIMKKRFAVNVEAQYVAFASLYDATITVTYPDGTTDTVALTRTGANPDAPYSAYFTNIPEGTLFQSDKRLQGWYEPNVYDHASRDDETLLIGYD